MLIQFLGRTLHSNNGDTLSSDTSGTGHLSKVTSGKLKRLIHPMLIQLVGRTLRSDNGGSLR